MKPLINTIAYYLPQYHPVPENDEWWGKGFTEWTNVTKAKPFFRNHKQPKFPADLSYYDLRVPEVRQAQANMARDNGITGFCYYHYWFGNGRQMLNLPIDEVIEQGTPDFPFCFCWANQSWTGHWFGAEKRMLIKQEYPGDYDIEAHFSYLLKAFNDKRYIRIDNKPVFKILDIRNLPDPAAMAKKLKELALANGFDGLYLIAGNFVPEGWNPTDHHFDAVTDNGFSRTLNAALATKNNLINRLLHNKYTKKILGEGSYFKNRNTITMKEFMDQYFVEEKAYPNFPIVIPNWDNTPRALSKGTVIRNADPAYFSTQLEIAGEYIRKKQIPPIIFIKSWNEWAEGNWLEPDTIIRHGYLQAVKSFVSTY